MEGFKLLINELNQGKDTTIEPAHFANTTKKTTSSGDLAELKAAVQKLQVDVGNLQTECENVRGRIDSTDEQVNNLVNQLNTAIENLQGQIDNLNITIDGITEFDSVMEDKTLVFKKNKIKGGD